MALGGLRTTVVVDWIHPPCWKPWSILQIGGSYTLWVLKREHLAIHFASWTCEESDSICSSGLSFFCFCFLWSFVLENNVKSLGEHGRAQ